MKVDIDQLVLHPALDLVPKMRPDEYEVFCADIAERGIQVPIELDAADGKTVLDGRHRLLAAADCDLAAVPARRVRLNGTAPAEYILKSAALRRHLSDAQRQMMAAMWMKENRQKPGPKSTEPVAPLRGDAIPDRYRRKPALVHGATLMNVSPKSVEKAAALLKQAPDVAAAVHDGAVVRAGDARALATLPKPVRRKALTNIRSGKQVRAAIKEARDQQLEKATATARTRGKRFQVIHGNLDTVGMKRLKPNSVDVIITDPPYGKQHLPLYDALGRVAERVLRPGGSCIVMSGQVHLPAVWKALAEHLTYHWVAAYLTPGGQSVQVFDRRVNTFWKPLLWFVKGKHEGAWVGDVCKSDINDNDKRFHEWGQSVSGMGDIVDRFSQPDDRILDPFCGAGTTGVAAVAMGRKFVGIDVDELAVKSAAARIGEAARGS